MAAWAAKAVVKVEVAEGGIEVVAPEQADHAAAEPHAFGISGWAAQDPLGFGEFVRLLDPRVLGSRALRVGWFGFRGLGQSRGDDRTSGCGDEPGSNTQDADKLKHAVGHGSLGWLGRFCRKDARFPDCLVGHYRGQLLLSRTVSATRLSHY